MAFEVGDRVRFSDEYKDKDEFEKHVGIGTIITIRGGWHYITMDNCKCGHHEHSNSCIGVKSHTLELDHKSTENYNENAKALQDWFEQ